METLIQGKPGRTPRVTPSEVYVEHLEKVNLEYLQGWHQVKFLW